jgi:hypothetical protein
MSDMGPQAGPHTRREAALRIILGEVSELFKQVDALVSSVRALTRKLDEVKASIPAPTKDGAGKPGRRRTSYGLLAGAALVAGLVSGGLVLTVNTVLMQQTRDDARVGRAVKAVFPLLDTETRDKLQAAINANAHQ